MADYQIKYSRMGALSRHLIINEDIVDSGRVYIYGIPTRYEDKTGFKEALKQALNLRWYEDELRDRDTGGVPISKMCVEITMNPRQFGQSGDFENNEDILEEFGFVQVSEFENPNSGNDVRVYLRTPQ